MAFFTVVPSFAMSDWANFGGGGGNAPPAASASASSGKVRSYGIFELAR